MSTHMTKTWFVDGEFIKQEIPETELYKSEQQRYIDAIVAHAREIEIQAGNEFQYGQYIGLLRATKIIEKGFHEDFSNPRLSS